MTITKLFAASLLILASGCAFFPDEEVKPEKDARLFDASYYKENAAEYFQGRQYPRAREQFVKLLELDPDNWTGKLGLAFTDYYIAREFVVTKGDQTTARSRSEFAEKEFRDIWNGTIEPSTEGVDIRRPQWKAALGVAMTIRQLGVLDGLEADRFEAEAKKGGKNAEESLRKGVDAEARRDARYKEAITIYEKLAAQEFASPQAISDLAELYVVKRQDAKAEALYLRWLDAARRTREGLASRKTEITASNDKESRAISTKFIDEKLSSNAEKQAAVLSDLAGLAWARGEWQRGRKWIEEAITVAPDSRTLYLKLAQFEEKLMMFETGIVHVDEFLRRTSRVGTEFDDATAEALRLRKRMESELAKRPKPKTP